MRLILRLLAGLALSVAAAGPSLANLIVTPTRIVLSDEFRGAEFRAVNTSSEVREYQIAWRQMRMAANGQLVDRTRESAAGASSAIVQVSPTRIRLSPGEAQVIRLRLRNIPNLPMGEYISHLTFQPTGGAASAASGATAPQASSLQLRVNLAISVPVVVRHGPLTAQASLSIDRLSADPPGIAVSLTRSGQASVYGNLEAYWSATGQEAIRIGVLNGVAVYPNLTGRAVMVPLLPSARLQPGIVQVVYRAEDDGSILTQAAVRVR